VEASDGNGAWDSKGAAITFYRAPHFVQTLRFYALATVSLATLIIAVHRLRLRSLRDREHKLLRIVDQRTNELKLAKETAEALPGYSLHMADSGTDNFDRDFALSLLSLDQDAVYEIEEALKRIEKNTYGVCELTGKNIPKARLAAIPWTRFTVEAQAQLEKEGALRSRKLGQLGTIDNSGGSDSESADEEEGEEKPAKEKE